MVLIESELLVQHGVDVEGEGGGPWRAPSWGPHRAAVAVQRQTHTFTLIASPPVF